MIAKRLLLPFLLLSVLTGAVNAQVSINQVNGLQSALNSKAAKTSVVTDPFALINRSIVGDKPWLGYNGNSNGTNTGQNTRMKHIALAGFCDPEFVYGNFRQVGDVDTPGSNTITVSAGFEYPSGTIYPMFAGSTTTLAIAPGAYGRLRGQGIEVPPPATYTVNDNAASTTVFVTTCPTTTNAAPAVGDAVYWLTGANVEFNPCYVSSFNAGTGAITLAGNALLTAPANGDTFRLAKAYWSRSFVTVNAGEFWPQGTATSSNYGDGSTQSNGETDKTLSGSISASTTQCYSPVAILGTTVPRVLKQFWVVSHSFGHGTNDVLAALSNQNIDLGGHYQRAFQGYYGFMRASRTSAKFQLVSPNSARFMRSQTISGCQYAICGLGVNDFTAGTSLANVQSYAITLW